MPELSHLRMRRPRLDNLPELVLPEGFALRSVTANELPELACLLAASFPELIWTPQKAHEALFADLTVKETLALVEEATGIFATTASARLLPERFPDAGYLHWVGAHQSFRGKGLGRLVTLAVLHKFRERGCTSAVLETQDFRLPALQSYLKLGFEPEHADDTHAARWEAILNPPLGKQPVTQVAFVVKDMDVARQAWAKALGVPIPDTRLTIPGNERDLTYLGQATGAQAKLAFFNLGQVQIELIEPVAGSGPSVWDNAPEGVHHLAFRTKNMAATRDALAAVGVPLVFRGDSPNGAQMAYFDARDSLGLYFEFAEAQKTPL
ncbi:MAG: GNAT family N-acetyltransferase [Armatimonadetes bacterium]|nr:GNAT family N-acetyltransferase [Armatimonadota bacterium]